MRLTPVCAITLALSLCGAAAAQVGTLVRHDTANDPCQKFKMRVLMPADASPKARSESPVGSPDPGIVWNPCQGDVIQIAGTGLITLTPEQGMSPAVPSFELQSPTPGRERQPLRAYSYSPPLR